MASDFNKKLKKYYEKEKPASNRKDKSSIYYEVSGDEKALIEDIQSYIGKIKEFGKGTDPNYQTLGLDEFSLDYSVIENSKSELKPLLEALKQFHQTTEEYKKVASAAQKNDSLNKTVIKFEKKIECYRDTFKAYNQGLAKLETFKNFDEKAFINQVSKTEKMFSANYQRDLEVIRALEFVGFECFKDDKGNWKAKELPSSANGRYYSDDKGVRHNVLSEVDVNSFLGNYLNKPYDQREGHIITADGILKLYLEETKEKQDIHKTIFKNVKIDGIKSKENIETLSEYEALYSTSSAEWQNFLSESSSILINDAVKMAYAELYAENMTGDVSLLEDASLQKLSDSIVENFKGFQENRQADKLKKVIEHADGLNIKMNNSPEYDLLDIRKKYDKRLKNLEARAEVANLSDEKRKELDGKIENAKQSCYRLEVVKTFAKKLVGELDRDSYNSLDLYKKDMSQILNLLSQPEFLTFDDNDKLSFDKNSVPDAFKDQFDHALEMMEGFDETFSYSGNEKLEIEDLNNLILEYANDPTADNFIGNSIKEELLYEVTESLVSKENDNELTLLIDKYRQIHENRPDDPNCENFSSFISAISTPDCQLAKNEGEPLFTLESLDNVEQLTRLSAGKGYTIDPKQVQDANDKRANIRSNADSAYEMFARIKSYLQNKFPGLTRSEITPGEIRKAYSDVAKQMQYEKDNGIKYQLTPEEAQYLKDMKDQQSSAYAKNIDDYVKSGKVDGFGEKLKDDVVNLIDPMLKNQEDKQEKMQKMKFAKKYPRDKTAELLKKFKPYCAKSTGKLIEKLMKMIENCDIYVKSKNSTIVTSGDNGTTKGENDNEDENSTKDENNTAGIDPDKLAQMMKNGNDGTKTVDDNNATTSSGNPSNPSNATASSSNPSNPTTATPPSSNPSNATDRTIDDDQTNQNTTTATNPSNTGASANTQTATNPQNANTTDTNNPQETQNEVNKKMPTYNSGEQDYSKKLEFASYKILSLGLEKILTDKEFKKNARWLDEKERGNLKDLQTVMDFIIASPNIKEGTPEYEKIKNLKRDLSEELWKKSITTDEKYKLSDLKNADLMPKEVYESMINVSKNCNMETMASIMSITTDLTKVKLGNKLYMDLVEKIATSEDKDEVWEIIKGSKDLIYDIWNTPGNISSRLEKELNEKEKEEEEKSSEEKLENGEPTQENKEEKAEEESKDDYSTDFVEEGLSEEERLKRINEVAQQLNSDGDEMGMM